LAFAVMALFLCVLTWSIFGWVDIVAVAPGRIVVSERTKVVQPLATSVVKRVLVDDGDRVVAGQPLVELDPTAAHADNTSAREQFKAAMSEVLRARAIQAALVSTAGIGLYSRPGSVSSGPGGMPSSAVAVVPSPLMPGALMPSFPAEWSAAETAAARAQLQGEWSDITAKLGKLASEAGRRSAEIDTARQLVEKLAETVPLARTRERDFITLVEQGFMSGHATQDKTRERIELEHDLATQQAHLLETQAGLRESENARNAYLAEVRRGLYEREAQSSLRREQASQEQAKAAQREELTTLRSPVAGVVQQLAIHTTGGVVTEAQALMVIVPDGAKVTAEVTLDNKDIGFVNVGDAAEIKLETFLFTRYGTVHAKVERVTADAVTDEKRGAIFPVTLTLSRNRIDIDGKSIALAPGMNVTAEIKTGRRRVIEYLLSPIQRAGSESLHER
ncbi:MAG: HlyD family type secretion periplasmic adaptor subunit, partial [Rhizobacter sp.]|nr:HlyD family type secretion periplasmic adaptor subunit [Rhizobacter sp.]